MKKNYRIVSAAAAALLAVAPVATSAVTAVSADTTAPAPAGSGVQSGNINITNGTAGATNADKKSVNVKFNVTNAANLKDGDLASSVQASISTDVGSINVTGVVNSNTNTVDMAYVYEVADNGTIGTTPVNKLQGGHTYVAVAKSAVLSGLNATTKYTVTGATSTISDVYGHDMKAFDVQSSKFTVPDATKKGNIYFVKSVAPDVAITKDSIDMGSVGSVDSLAALIKSEYEPAIDNTDSATAPKVDWQDVESDIRAALKDANVTVKSDGTFVAPANYFTVKVTAVASNGKTAVLPIRVNTTTSSDSAYASYPQIGVLNAGTIADGKTFGTASLPDNAPFNYVKINGTVDTKAIGDYFGAYLSKANHTLLPVTVDASKVNTKVAGKYPVTLTATNPAGLTARVTFDLTVGDKGQHYATVQSDTDIPVYTIDGNNVTAENGTTIANGTQVAVFDTVSVNGKNYTRINKADGNEFVEAKYVDGSFVPSKKTTVTVMHNAYIYDKDHKRVGTKKISSYTDTTVYGDKTKLNDGTEAYMIADGQYIDAGNVDGYKVTLNHNSYIYKTSKKRANHKKLLKGTTVTVYGSSFTFKNGQKYYRIGKGQYIKVVNADIVK